MSALPTTVEARFEPLAEPLLDAVVAVELQAYTHPWSRGNFRDSLAAGYEAQALMAGDTLLGYFVAMKGVDEVHLLNITVAPAFQRQGWARVMLDALALWSRGQDAQWLWLEVRKSNLRAQHVYVLYGFRSVGERRRYYPAHADEREDAIVMSLRL
ncbi:ribosomal protein S18-alanine N-acetyltransferase [Ramlibacter sp. H39-3-26]|uniref:ribosomal protein S18-alanine N-acetyltransferase n=1 Tax=Curvibacter soli TaxID=3031331 RepID=UPI0023DA92D1|nr:ribosomal protein S18-alanine N-acetyltransferase [Ramlibacter sp. H39-3-26]MDF1484596.1 ribosomal protein S18-alanine N-acetyltransferase [Ramlibacter sp. H39-3-26]